jgi:thiamine pyrophosphokinase
MRAIVFANGHLTDSEGIRRLIQPDDYIIAADGGTRHALAVGVMPAVIIGDLDSIAAEELAHAEAAGATIQRYSSRKDETDLELALRHAVAHGVSDIIILTALGGRIDQMLGNLFLLTLPDIADQSVRILDGQEEIFLIRRAAHLTGTPGDTVSILPIGGAAVGVFNEGLEWPLHDETLPVGSPRGISNVLVGERATIRVRAGMLLCIVTHLTGSTQSL